jgi:hypothetical protein
LARWGLKIFLVGLVVTSLFFALAPRSPFYAWLEGLHPGLPGLLGLVAGIAGLLMVLAGYVLYLFETRPRPLALYEAARLASLIAWVSTGLAVYQGLLGGQGLGRLLVSLTVSSPILALLYLLIIKPLRRRARRSGVVIIVPGRS